MQAWAENFKRKKDMEKYLREGQPWRHNLPDFLFSSVYFFLFQFHKKKKIQRAGLVGQGQRRLRNTWRKPGSCSAPGAPDNGVSFLDLFTDALFSPCYPKVSLAIPALGPQEAAERKAHHPGLLSQV